MENKQVYEVLLRIEIGPEEDLTIDQILDFEEFENVTDCKITVMAKASPRFDLSFFDTLGLT